MQTHSHGEIASIEGGNWWYAARREVIRDTLAQFAPADSKTVLDVGCGVGANLDLLTPYGADIIGVEPSEVARSLVAGKGYTRLLDAGAESLPLADQTVGLALIADVLEHVDDEAALRELMRVLKNGGRVVATVPAYEALWNENDDYSQHLRRYTRAELLARFKKAGFNILSVQFWNFSFVLPVWVVARFYTRKGGGASERLSNNLSSIPAWADGLILAWMRLEHLVGKVLPLPVGVSLVLVAEKP